MNIHKRRLTLYTVLAATLVLLGLFSALYVLRLDSTIREKFDGKRWSLPAVVYARALELYPGLAFSPQMLEDELQLTGYHRADTAAGVGAYVRRGEAFDIVTRDFQYPSGLEKSDRITVRFHGRTGGGS